MLSMALKESQIQSLASIYSSRLKGQRLSKIVQYDSDVFSFGLSSSGRLNFVLNSGDPYVYLSSSPMDVVSLSTPFSMLLRKEVSNAVIERVFCVNEDRVLGFELKAVDSIFREITLYLIAELIPTKANLILLDESKKVLGALRTNRITDPRPIFRGIQYEPPLKNDSLTYVPLPFDEDAYQKICIEKEAKLKEKRKKTRFSHLYRYCATKEKSLRRKEKSIAQDIEKAKAHLDDGEYGNYIYMNMDSLHPETGTMDVYGVSVPLDPSQSLVSNAENFFRRAKKAKATLAQAEKYLEEAVKEAEEYRLLVQNLDSCDEAMLEKLSKEYGLEETGNKKKGLKTPLSGNAIHPYSVEEGGVYYVFGKNASQNDFLSFLLLTKSDYLWFHVKEGHGAHLILQKENPNNEEITLACELCLLASSREEGEVLYTQHKNIRRGNVKGQAIVRTYQSAYFRQVSPKAKETYLKAKKWQAK